MSKSLFDNIPNEWRIVKFGDYVEVKHGHQFRHYDYTDEGLKIFKITQIQKDNSIDLSKCSFIDESRLDEFRHKQIEKDDILMALTGATIGKTAKIREDYGTLLQNYRVGKFYPLNEQKVSKSYLYYYLLSDIFQNQMISRVTQSAQQNIGKEDILNMDFILPPIETQKKIGSMLETIDNKIHVNSMLNKIFDSLANIIFKRWFVDFEFPDENGEPYRSSGGTMKNSELGEIPEKWNINDLDFYGEIAGGSTPSTNNEEYWNGNIPWITPKDLSNFKSSQIFIGRGERSITQKALDENSLRWFSKDSIIFSSRAPIGYIAIAENDLTCNQGFKNIIPYQEFYREYLFYLMKEITDRIVSIAGGSTFKEISGTFLKQMQVIVPPDDLIKKFHDTTQSIFEYNKISVKSNEQLSKLRDLLLPRLMSGEIHIRVEDV